MYTKIIIILYLLLSYSFAQRSPRDFERELKAQNSAIQSLKDEIEQTKKRIQSENKKEKSSVRKVSNLSEEIALLQKLLKELGKEEKLLVADISRLERKIKESEKNLENLRKLYAKRLATMYKKGQISNLEKVLSSTSWRQAIYRSKYLKIISKIDQDAHDTIRSLLIEVGKQKINIRICITQKKISKKRERKNTIAGSLKKEKRAARAIENKKEPEGIEELLIREAGGHETA